MRHLISVSLVSLVVAASTVPARAEDLAYRLEPGDVLEFAVVGMPDLRQRSAIDIEGNVTFPMVGSVDAAGLSLAQLRAVVQERAGRSVVRQRTSDGRDISIALNANEVYVTVTEYRPVYVDGDVSKPGEVAYRPGMTVRQALALAGGYDVARFQATNPFLQAPDLAADYETLTTERARQEMRVARLEAERDGEPAPPAMVGPQAAPILTHLGDLEADQFHTRVADREKRNASFDTIVTQINAQIETLTEQKANEEAGVQADDQELTRIKDLLERGMANMLRVTDTRRNLLLSSTRLLQTASQLERARRDREDVLRDRQHSDDSDRLEIISQLQDARLQLASTRARLAATREKLLYTSVVRSQLIEGTGITPRLVVIRKQPDGTRKILAEEDMVLLPSDVVEATLAGAAPGTISAAPDPARVDEPQRSKPRADTAEAGRSPSEPTPH